MERTFTTTEGEYMYTAKYYRMGGYMSNRVTIGNLQALVDQINDATGNPRTAWTKQTDGSVKANVGNYHLDQAYGGVGLVQHMNEGGGVTTIINGFRPKRELFYLLRAYLDGIHARKEK